MNTAHLHLLLNHLPMIGTVMGTLILIAGFLLKNNPTIKQTALGVLIFSALTAIPANLTGEGAEELVEKLPGISETNIETHEDLGKLFLIVMLLLGSLSLLTFLASLFKTKFSSALYILVLVFSIGTSVFAKTVGTSGGEIRHSEIRSDAPGQNGNAPVQENNGESDDD
ncbi:MAG TPA: hypothetical protein DIW47_09940 [Bacteroidetes bacterium]|nr:hypothetical protein [Bacteroidota bacterium]